MDYARELYNNLLSDTNINHLLGIILTNYKISNNASQKCAKIIKNYLTSYFNNIDRYPQNNEELLQAINYLNQKCYDEFVQYLHQKYPNINLTRASNNQQNNQQNNIRSLNSPNHDESLIKPINTSELIILSEQEKNELLKKYKPKPTADDFLSYLMNPTVLQMFTMITGQNKNYQHELTKPTIVFDEILDDNQVQNLIKLYKSDNNNNNTNNNDNNTNNNTNNNNTNNNNTNNNNTNNNNTNNNNNNNNDNNNNNNNDNNNNNNNNDNNNDDNDDNDDNIINTSNKNIKISDIELIVKSVDNLISKDLTQSDLPLLRDEMNKLSTLKSKYLSENNKLVISQIDDLMNQIAEKVKKFRDKLETVANDSKKKINTITSHTSHSLNTEENADYLNLEIDPTIDTIDLKNDNYNDLKNIKIELKTDKKITEITLMSYFLPTNNYNITRFNNKFVIYFNNKITKIIIPPNTYTLETLFKYITSQASYLNFTVDKNNIITIKNTMDMDFDLLCDRIEETILPMLGFRDKANKYKQKTSYTASTVYNLDANHVYFSLSGSAMEPFHAELDKEVTLNKSIKKSRSGIIMKQIILNFKNGVDQYYDFSKPFKICLKITYL
ncbi:hypothetical protein [Powai lake megavirus]|uniref:Uncharacterized protein n=1 Tax=Powai lake megavirus TaxID=1842663 RepID=A0A167RGG9_9VIRU|nr:hypothetical protein QJ849_gp493 [Powai lake megavirus]ANB50655.1 hypothetical protein [Powai lake megavirus]